VYHFDVIPGPDGSTISGAGLSIDLCGTFGKYRFDAIVCMFGSTWHERWTIPCPFFSTADAHSHKQDSFLFEFLRSSNLIGPIFVTTINDQITRFEMFGQCLNGHVDGFPRLYENDNVSWFFEFLYEILWTIGSHDGQVSFVLGSLHSAFDFGQGSISHAHRKPVLGHVQCKILTLENTDDEVLFLLLLLSWKLQSHEETTYHDGQSIQSNVTTHVMVW
jgi:hypothetical protein